MVHDQVCVPMKSVLSNLADPKIRSTR
jgi:hypothetical protein